MNTKIIKDQVALITNHPSFVAWLKTVKISPDDLIAINNSFVFRQDIKTVKSEKYLGLQMNRNGKISALPVVMEGINFNADFKIYKTKNLKKKPLNLSEAISSELKNLGLLVLILIGEIQDTMKAEETVNHKSISNLRLDPTSLQKVTLTQKTVTINDTSDEEGVWNDLVSQLTLDGRAAEADNALRNALGIALDHLESKAFANLVLPKQRPVRETILDSIIKVLTDQREDYKIALNLSNGDRNTNPQAFNELLRIAYNFSSDAVALVRLILSICDLKPLVLWGVIGTHYQLSESFRSLPWTRSRNKASLSNYKDTISDARNSAFHNIFPFRKSINVDLPNKALRGLSLRIFSPYVKKKENDLQYEDKELIRVLTEFTRAGEHQVSSRFWHQNLKIIDETIELFEGTRNLLLSTMKP